MSWKIFLPHEVFNTSVDKFVEKRLTSKANCTLLSTLARFALFLCNSLFARRKIFQSERLDRTNPDESELEFS